MDTRQLEIFVSLASTLHFGRTAERHAMSASALSRLVQRLEGQAGATLFERDNRQVKLTDAGVAYARFANASLAAWERYQDDAGHTDKALSGEVSLYCSVTASHSLLTPILAQLRARYPDVQLRVHTGDQALSFERLKQESEDLVMAAIPEEIPGGALVAAVSSSDLVFIAPRDGDISEQLQLDPEAAWRRAPWVLAERGLSRQRLDSWFRQKEFSPEVYAEVSGHEAIVSMVGLGFGVGLVPELVLSNSPASDKIRILRPHQVLQSENFKPFRVGLCVLKRKLASPLIAAIWETVSELQQIDAS